MYGWRARIGAILGRPNAVCEPEFNEMVPEGVSVHGARMFGHAIARYNDPQVMKDMEGFTAECATAMTEFVPNILVFTHNASSMASVDFNNLLTKTMEEKGGCPALTTGTALVDALNAVNAKNIAVTDPFPKPWLTEIVHDFLEDPQVGFKIVNSSSAKGDSPQFITNMSPSVAYKFAREADHPDADAVVLTANVWRTLEVIEPLEQDLGKPVITANQATIWAALRMLGIGAVKGRYGSLFDID